MITRKNVINDVRKALYKAQAKLIDNKEQAKILDSQKDRLSEAAYKERALELYFNRVQIQENTLKFCEDLIQKYNEQLDTLKDVDITQLDNNAASIMQMGIKYKDAELKQIIENCDNKHMRRVLYRAAKDNGYNIIDPLSGAIQVEKSMMQRHVYDGAKVALKWFDGTGFEHIVGEGGSLDSLGDNEAIFEL